MIHVARPGQTDDGVQQQDAIDLVRGPLRELLVDTMQRVPCLERHHVRPTRFLERGTGLRRRVPEITVVRMPRKLEDGDLAGQVASAPPVHLGDQRVSHIGCTEYFVGSFVEVPLVYLFDVHDRQQVVSGVAQRDFLALRHRHVVAYRKRDWDRKQRPVCQAHVVEHTLIIVFGHESVERRKPADCHQLQVACNALGDLNRRQLICFSS